VGTEFTWNSAPRGLPVGSEALAEHVVSLALASPDDDEVPDPVDGELRLPLAERRVRVRLEFVADRPRRPAVGDRREKQCQREGEPAASAAARRR